MPALEIKPVPKAPPTTSALPAPVRDWLFKAIPQYLLETLREISTTTTDVSAVNARVDTLEENQEILSSIVVTGPVSATDNALARYDDDNGKIIQDSVIVADDSGNVSGVGTFLSSPGAAAPTLAVNGHFTWRLTSNTNLRFYYRGSDGTTRTADVTLA